MNRPFLFCLAVSLLAPCAYAQDGGAKPAPKTTFADLLRERWQIEKRPGVFLTVLPLGRLPVPKNAQDGVSPSTFAGLLAAWPTTTRSFGGVTALAPSRINVYNTSFAPPRFDETGNPWQDRRNAVPQLLATLSPVQWREIASPQGLAYGGLSSEQKALWEIGIPKPFVFDRTTTQYALRVTPKENLRELSESERYQVRLRVKLTGDAAADLANKSGRVPVIFHKNLSERGSGGETFLHLKTVGAYGGPKRTDDNVDLVYGQPIARREPARPKLLPIEFEKRLTPATVSLAAPEGNQPLTVAVLLARCESALGLKIAVGDPVKSVPVSVFGNNTAPADAVIRALLFSAGYTVRVAPSGRDGDDLLFLVTETAEPMGQIWGRFADWYITARAGENNLGTEANRRIADQNPLPLLRFDDDDPLPLSGDLKQRVFEAARRTESGTRDGRSGSVIVSLAELPSIAQKEINERAKALADMAATPQTNGEKYDFRVRVDKIEVNCSPWLSYVVPGTGDLAGEIDGEPLSTLSEWLPRKDSELDRLSLEGRTIIVSVDSEEEVRNLVRAAREKKARELWVQAVPELVAVAVREAGGAVPVRNVISLLRVAEDTPDNLPREQNVYGKTNRDWLVPDDASVAAWVTGRVRDAARVPGIAGVVVRDIAPPGYRGAEDPQSRERTTTGDIGAEHGGSQRLLGYTLARRRAFLQEMGRDPADITTADLYTSPFAFDRAAFSDWLRWNEKQITPLWNALREAAGTTPVLAEGEATFRANEWVFRAGLTTFVPWNEKAAKPPLAALFRNANFTVPDLASTPETLMVIAGNAATDLAADEILRRLKRTDKPELTVLDLSDPKRPGVAEWLRVLKRRPAP